VAVSTHLCDVGALSSEELSADGQGLLIEVHRFLHLAHLLEDDGKICHHDSHVVVLGASADRFDDVDGVLKPSLRFTVSEGQHIHIASAISNTEGLAPSCNPDKFLPDVSFADTGHQGGALRRAGVQHKDDGHASWSPVWSIAGSRHHGGIRRSGKCHLLDGDALLHGSLRLVKQRAVHAQLTEKQ
jgi:hypothetical protein